MKRFLAIALITCFSPIALPQDTRANPAIIGAAGCAASGICGVIVGTIVVAGVLYYVINSSQGRRSRVRASGFEIHSQPIPQPSRMLNDPEKEEYISDEEPVLADSLQEAQRKCRHIANARGLQVQGIKEPSRKGGKRYICKLGGYVER